MNSFFSLTPDAILDSVELDMAEQKPGTRLTGRAIALNSLENRVYDLEYNDETNVVAKFYRPGRWNREQILEEHAFTQKLADNEVPAVAPFVLKNGSTIGNTLDGIFFAVFPKVRGRILDELKKEHLEKLGRLLGRMHNIGETHVTKHRRELNLKQWVDDSIETLLQTQTSNSPMFQRYVMSVKPLQAEFHRLFKMSGLVYTHGDCHLGNVLWDSHANPFFLDFDDSMRAPPVQDFWMIIRGRDEEAVVQRKILINSYESFREFDDSSLKWIEPMRIMRIIHYSAWIARRIEDPSFTRAFPLFGSDSYWQNEVQAIEDAKNAWESSRQSPQHYSH
ncbi:MAG: serine/threonine protein kinase [Xanthomonadaceae bacterium]|nr:serine/threonine protein kinase [Xanthomonadaceae bacterium]